MDDLELDFESIKVTTLTMKAVGEMISNKRKKLGMNQAELARYACTSQPAICYLENGSYPIKNSSVVAAICHAICDDGSIFAAWIIAYLQLPFFSEADMRNAIDHMKDDMLAGPLHVETEMGK